ncbi:DUF4342 domain-containing protein [uncultured Clostridium sp.]|uniref:DUF4342 domain-containing protein n=1 Tax=uncultured Clostridium sp. TaxID=59620 RepID=UPI00262E1440|nr:DUF4342 domain-containing protein [uncultured Clostridium sp.]
MDKITLEKVDKVIERTSVTYKEAKEALENADGDILDAIILIEEKNNSEILEENLKVDEKKLKKEESVEEFKGFIMSLVNKGTISRIKIKKEDNTLLDLPVNAGIAASVIAITLPPILAGVAIAIVGAKLTVEVTKLDGTVEILNRIVAEKAIGIKEKSKNVAGIATTYIKVKANNIVSKHGDGDEDMKSSVIDTIRSMKGSKDHKVEESTGFSYTVNFENVE